MKAHLHNAERCTSDDLLTLELAYKHDPIVIALIRQITETNEMLGVYEEDDSDLRCKNDDMQGEINELEEKISDLERGISDAITGLGAIREFKKAEMVENITEIMAELEGLKS